MMVDGEPWTAETERYFGAGTSNAPIQFVETSVSGIADGLSKVMALSDAVRLEIGAKGKTWVSKGFTWKKIASDMLHADQEV